ncbi:FHA domain-containing protein [Exilibacterium tricleocarpae]|uniref:FHA domain-containing protein n=1 Tax=Exilibacterium tricleocarpae TaxID=2591008 RepID=A0A545TZH7_9GAMM|nr:FHA domain-containing protein [Exilibacterium tricleocarpae]TQV82593.1 FHA domain-containing protein [Exilibacterium tricleocarpae]
MTSELTPDKNPTTRINTKFKRGAQAEPAGIELFFRGDKYQIAAEALPFSIGRDHSCQLVIDSGVVSRVHCALELRDGQIGLLDQSTNGTSVRSGRAGSVIVKDKFYPLAGRGSIQLGAEVKLDDPDVILFKIVGSGDD